MIGGPPSVDAELSPFRPGVPKIAGLALASHSSIISSKAIARWGMPSVSPASHSVLVFSLRPYAVRNIAFEPGLCRLPLLLEFLKPRDLLCRELLELLDSLILPEAIDEIEQMLIKTGIVFGEPVDLAANI